MIDNDLSRGKGVNINITFGNADYLNHFGNIKDMIKQYMPVAYSNGAYTLYIVRKPELKEKP